MYTKQEQYYLGLVALMRHLEGGIKGELNVILNPSQARFLLPILMGEKDRVTRGNSAPMTRLIDKAISTAERAIESFGKDFEDE